ncbi:MAG: hypothetical protein KC492_34070 [Myxococcales bacterium]|nr:hypothetical protein [Myxococcales bacterium]
MADDFSAGRLEDVLLEMCERGIAAWRAQNSTALSVDGCTPPTQLVSLILNTHKAIVASSQLRKKQAPEYDSLEDAILALEEEKQKLVEQLRREQKARLLHGEVEGHA